MTKKSYRGLKYNGYLLVDLMVGLVISALVIIAAIQIYTNFEEDKITTQNVGDAVFNVALAQQRVGVAAKNAWFGINATNLFGCNTRGFRTDVGDFNFLLSPVRINSTNDMRHEITFIKGSSNRFFAPMSLIQNKSAGQTTLRVNSRFGINLGDLLLLGSTTSTECLLFQVSGLPQDAGTTDQVRIENTIFLDPLTNSNTNTTYNKTGGLGVDYMAGANVLNLGREISIITYLIDNENNLIEIDMLNNRSQIVASNVVGMQAVYGVDTNNDKSVDIWEQNITNVQRSGVIGIRLSILTQTRVQARAVNGVCGATTNPNIRWLNGQFDVSGLSDWGCHRYRILQTTLPLKNALWG